MVTDILRAEKHTVRQRLEEHARVDQPGDRFESKTADCFHLLTDFAQLRNTIAVEIQAFETLEILGARVLAMRRNERFPNRLPNAVLEFRVRRIRYRIARSVVRCDLCDGIAPRAIFAIAKTGVIRIEVYKPNLDVIL